MAEDGDEQNPQQTRGENGLGSPLKKQKIFTGELPEQKGARGFRVQKEAMKNVGEAGPSDASNKQSRGRPSSGLSKEDKRKKHNEDCQRYRRNKNAEFQRLQEFEKDFYKEFGSLSPKHLKDVLCKRFGVTEEDLEDEIPGQKRILQENTLEEWLDGGYEYLTEFLKCGVLFDVQSAPMNELINQDAAECSRLQQTEIKQETLCEKFGATVEGLEGERIEEFLDKDKENSALYSEELEKLDKFLQDEPVEELSDVGYEELTGIMVEYGALLDGQSTVPGGEEAAMNKQDLPVDDFIRFSADQDEIPSQKKILQDKTIEELLDEYGISSDGQSSAMGGKEAAMNEPINPDEVQFQTHQSKPLPSDRVNKQNSIAPTGATKQAREKMRICKLIKGAAVGKENAIGRRISKEESTSKTNAATGMDGGSKGAKPCAPWKGGGTLVVPEQGKIGHQKEGKKATTAFHFR